MHGPEPARIRCEALRKVFHTNRRREGVGLFGSFFRRETLEVVALDSVDLALEPGEFVGLIGPNGAGKTTLVKALVGILPASAGRATLFGRDCFHLADRHKRRLSLVMGQRSQLWWDLPPIESFRLLRAIFAVEERLFERRVREYAERLSVTDRLQVQLRHLSLGQRMKMEIIGAFLHDPEIVFLDEPTIGLDLVSSETIRHFLLELNRGGEGRPAATIVLTSHDLEDIEATCSRLVILDRGRVLYDGPLSELSRRVAGRRVVEVHLEPGAEVDLAAVRRVAAEQGAELERADPLLLRFHLPASATQAFVGRLLTLVPVRDLAVERQPLEHLIRELFRGREPVGSASR